MKTYLIAISVSILFLCIMGCASGNRSLQSSTESSTIINEPFEVVWNRTIDFLKSGEIRITIRNADRGYIDTEYINLSTKQADHYLMVTSKRLGSEEKKARIKSTIFLWKLSDSSTLVRIITYGEVYESPSRYSPGVWYHAASTGQMEQELRAGIQKHLQFADN